MLTQKLALQHTSPMQLIMIMAGQVVGGRHGKTRRKNFTLTLCLSQVYATKSTIIRPNLMMQRDDEEAEGKPFLLIKL